MKFHTFKEKYCERILFESFKVLYKLLQNAPKVNIPFEVWRGVSHPYLKVEKNKVYYLSSFVSTSLSKDSSLNFLYDLQLQKNYLYKFIVYPGCNYLNVTNVSHFKEEKEVILAPFHIYTFIQEEKQKFRVPKYGSVEEFIVQTFAIFPTNLTIPEDFKSFMKWKTNLIDLSSEYSSKNMKAILKGHCKRGKTRKILKQKSCYLEPIHSFELK